MKKEARKGPYVMSLTLSSDVIPMAPILRETGLVAEHLHRRGEPIAAPKLRSQRIATRHYASVASGESSNEKSVSDWLEQTIHFIDGHSGLSRMIQSEQVKATPWIAILAFDPTPLPLRFDPSLIEAVTRLGAKILIEDYNRENAEGLVPQVTWIG